MDLQMTEKRISEIEEEIRVIGEIRHNSTEYDDVLDRILRRLADECHVLDLISRVSVN
jgi:hypothetical protein